jgi:hypothetical protein
MGVYKRLGDVPPERRLTTYQSGYEGRDVWGAFLTNHLFEMYDSKRFKEDAHRAGRRWRSHVEPDTHHALATPADVEAWSEALLSELALKTAYNQYWVRVERFYSWLQSHREHPHCYHPVWMAAASGGSAGEIWDEKMRRAHGSER